MYIQYLKTNAVDPLCGKYLFKNKEKFLKEKEIL
jgi:hypothetical protein